MIILEIAILPFSGIVMKESHHNSGKQSKGKIANHVWMVENTHVLGIFVSHCEDCFDAKNLF